MSIHFVRAIFMLTCARVITEDRTSTKKLSSLDFAVGKSFSSFFFSFSVLFFIFCFVFDIVL